MSMRLHATLASLGAEEREDAQLAFNIIADYSGLVEAEQVIMLGLSAALVDVDPARYSAQLGSAVAGRQLAAHGVVQTPRDIWEDETADPAIRTMSFALACELAATVRVVDAVEQGYSEALRVFDGPIEPD